MVCDNGTKEIIFVEPDAPVPVIYSHPVLTPVIYVPTGQPGPQGPPGLAGTVGNLVIGEVPAGAINGSNATFTTQFPFVPESVAVLINGLAQRKPDHFNTTGTNTITLSDSPTLGEIIQVNYLRA